MKKFILWIKTLVADPNGIADDARICGLLFVITFISLEVYDVVINKVKFDMQTYGIATASIAGGIGVWFLTRGSK